MRDQRFIAVHRGGVLDRGNHALLARWAAGCAEQVLPLFYRSSEDPRPGQAIEIACKWADGEVATGVAIRASVAAHAAARQAAHKSAIAAARSAGHAAATAHFADHCMGALLYALKALDASGRPWVPELESRLAGLPPHLRAPVADGVDMRLKKMLAAALLVD